MRRALAKSLGAVEERFVIQVQTDNAGTSADNQFSLPWIGTYDVDWGDGNVETGVVDTQTHTYPSAGVYDIKVTATTGRVLFNNGGDKSKLLDIKNWGTCEWTSMENAFKGCNNLDVTATDIPNFNSVTETIAMFYDCFSLIANPSIGNWDVSNVTYMNHMLDDARAFNQPIGDWDTSSVTDMSYMFNGARAFNQPIGDWDTSSVTDMSYMFNGARAFNQPIGDWDVSSVTNVRNMFYSATSFNQPIGDWDVSSVTTIQAMFRFNYNFDQSFANWDINNITTMIIFLPNSSLSTANYDATLISWAAQTPQLNQQPNFGGSQYTLGGAAEAARNTLINTYGWTITDGGGI